MARFPSGQRERTVNPLAQPSQVRILLSPPVFVYPGLPARQTSSGAANPLKVGLQDVLNFEINSGRRKPDVAESVDRRE